MGTTSISEAEWKAAMADIDRLAERIAELEEENARLTKENMELLSGKSASRTRIELVMRDGVPRIKLAIAKACYPDKSDKDALSSIRHQFIKVVSAGLIREVSPRVWQWVDRSKADNSAG